MSQFTRATVPWRIVFSSPGASSSFLPFFCLLAVISSSSFCSSCRIKFHNQNKQSVDLFCEEATISNKLFSYYSFYNISPLMAWPHPSHLHISPMGQENYQSLLHLPLWPFSFSLISYDRSQTQLVLEVESQHFMIQNLLSGVHTAEDIPNKVWFIR